MMSRHVCSFQLFTALLLTLPLAACLEGLDQVDPGNLEAPGNGRILKKSDQYLILSQRSQTFLITSQGKLDISSCIEPTHLYHLERGPLLYAGSEKESRICEIDLDHLSIRFVNDPKVNPVVFDPRFESGGIIATIDAVSSHPVVVINVKQEAACHAPQASKCLFSADGSYTSLGVLHEGIGYLLYNRNNQLYGTKISISTTGEDWTLNASLLLAEYSQTPFAEGGYRRLSEVWSYTASGTGNDTYAGEIPLRDKTSLFNSYSDKYFLNQHGYFRSYIAEDGSVQMSFTEVDLSAMYRKIGTTGGGPIPFLLNPSTQKSVSATILRDSYFYWAVDKEIYRIHRDASRPPEKLISSEGEISFYDVSEKVLTYWSDGERVQVTLE